MAWRVPAVWTDLQTGKLIVPENSKVLANQKRFLKAAQAALDAVYRDVREGLLETVGVDCVLSVEDRTSVMLNLPEEADADFVARAIDLENVEAWVDAQGKVNVAIDPWYSTKDTDQTVLSAIKVIHVLLGIHASDAGEARPKTIKQKLLAAVTEVLVIQKNTARKK